jgi:creatinine amidohydrolase
MIRPYVLKDTNWKTVKDQDYKIAILPWGATEAHNYHLPYSTDNYEAEYLAETAAGKAWDRGSKVITFPVVPFGVNTGQFDIDLCLNINPSTQYQILSDLTDVLDRQGLDKLVIINSHGGNNFKQMIRELYADFPDVFVCAINWWQVLDANKYFDEAGDHAGEMETSVMMEITPDLVLPLSDAGAGAENKSTIKGIRDGWVTTQRHWPSITSDTGVGDPAKSTREKGVRFLEDVTDKIADFLVDLSETPNTKLYES